MMENSKTHSTPQLFKVILQTNHLCNNIISSFIDQGEADSVSCYALQDVLKEFLYSQPKINVLCSIDEYADDYAHDANCHLSEEDVHDMSLLVRMKVESRKLEERYCSYGGGYSRKDLIKSLTLIYGISRKFNKDGAYH